MKKWSDLFGNDGFCSLVFGQSHLAMLYTQYAYEFSQANQGKYKMVASFI